MLNDPWFETTACRNRWTYAPARAKKHVAMVCHSTARCWKRTVEMLIHIKVFDIKLNYAFTLSEKVSRNFEQESASWGRSCVEGILNNPADWATIQNAKSEPGVACIESKNRYFVQLAQPMLLFNCYNISSLISGEWRAIQGCKSQMNTLTRSWLWRRSKYFWWIFSPTLI